MKKFLLLFTCLFLSSLELVSNELSNLFYNNYQMSESSRRKQPMPNGKGNGKYLATSIIDPYGDNQLDKILGKLKIKEITLSESEGDTLNGNNKNVVEMEDEHSSVDTYSYEDSDEEDIITLPSDVKKESNPFLQDDYKLNFYYDKYTKTLEANLSNCNIVYDLMVSKHLGNKTVSNAIEAIKAYRDECQRSRSVLEIKIDLSNNIIGNEGLEALGPYLRTLDIPFIIDVSQSHITFLGLEKIIEYLRACNNFMQIIIDKINDKDVLIKELKLENNLGLLAISQISTSS